MTFELWALVSIVFYLMALSYIPGIAKIQANDVIKQRNFNRDDMAQLTGKGARAQRALDNLYENIPAFTVLTLLVHITDAYNQMTFIAAAMFLTARILHPIFYIFGRPFLRSSSYMVGLIGVIILAVQLA